MAALLLRGAYAAADERLRAALERRPGDAALLGLSGLLTLGRRDDRAALARAERAVERAPGAGSLAIRARVLAALGERESARRDLAEAERLVDATPGVRLADEWLNIALAHLELRSYADARAALRRSLDLEPGSVASLLALGQVHLWEGSHDEASATVERVLALAPDNPQALVLRAASVV